MHELDLVQLRILGCLIEKELATPEYYPLTMNALLAACNQRSNRDPVLSLTEHELVPALDSLRAKHLCWEHHGAGSRSTKYSHNVTSIGELQPADKAVLAELLLRGPQTPGELRTHASRMAPMPELRDVTDTLERLAHHAAGPLVAELARQPGRRESRYAHLLSGETPADAPSPSAEPLQAPTPGPHDQQPTADLEGRIRDLECRVAALERELGVSRP